jgi:hypothetical protein
VSPSEGRPEHLGRILAKYATYYNQMRIHVSLGKDAPCTRPIERFGDIVGYPILGGLHHRYARNRPLRAGASKIKPALVCG